MKVLIWILSCLVLNVLNYIVGSFIGYGLGSVLMLLLWIFVARSLCKKWDIHKEKKRKEKLKAKAEAEGMTVRDYILKDLPENCIELCRFYRGKFYELEGYLKGLQNAKQISDDAYYYLLEEYKDE